MKQPTLVLCLIAIALVAFAYEGPEVPTGAPSEQVELENELLQHGLDPADCQVLKPVLDMTSIQSASWESYIGKPVTRDPCFYCGCLAQRRDTRKCTSYGCIDICGGW